MFRFKLALILLLISSPLYADVVSLEGNFVEGEADVIGHLNRDRVALTNGVNNIRGCQNGSVQSAGQVKADTVCEENMYDDANPRIRTAEGAGCPDLVYSGLLPSTSSSLVGSIPSGVAYPDGYRVEKSSDTSRTFTPDRWTYGYLLTSGSFDYQETVIDAAVPSALANSATLFRVSTDSTAITNVQDLRRVSCTNGPFSEISDVSTGPTLDDVLSNGAYVRRFSPAGRTPSGYAQGAFVSWDTHTTFKVTPGCLLINNNFRCVSTETTVPTTVDSPTIGTSGIDTTPIATSTRYYVYGIADQENVATYSITFSSNSSAPAGTTNSRLIGTIRTDATSLFSSRDVITVHALSEREIVGGWVNFEGAAGAINESYNVSGITDDGTGIHTVAWDKDYRTSGYAVAALARGGSTTNDPRFVTIGDNSVTVGAVQLEVSQHDATAQDATIVTVMSIGDSRS